MGPLPLVTTSTVDGPAGPDCGPTLSGWAAWASTAMYAMPHMATKSVPTTAPWRRGYDAAGVAARMLLDGTTSHDLAPSRGRPCNPQRMLDSAREHDTLLLQTHDRTRCHGPPGEPGEPRERSRVFQSTPPCCWTRSRGPAQPASESACPAGRMPSCPAGRWALRVTPTRPYRLGA